MFGRYANPAAASRRGSPLGASSEDPIRLDVDDRRAKIPGSSSAVRARGYRRPGGVDCTSRWTEPVHGPPHAPYPGRIGGGDSVSHRERRPATDLDPLTRPRPDGAAGGPQHHVRPGLGAPHANRRQAGPPRPWLARWTSRTFRPGENGRCTGMYGVPPPTDSSRSLGANDGGGQPPTGGVETSSPPRPGPGRNAGLVTSWAWTTLDRPVSLFRGRGCRDGTLAGRKHR